MQQRKSERGQTILLVAVSMFALVAMAALAIDVATLYVARSEAQAAADSAALAGAKAFVTSGYTTNPNGALSGSAVCSGGSPGSGLADLNARAAVVQNTILGVAPTITTTCNLNTSLENPQITVTVQRTALPLLFARIWAISAPGVTATATAEAFNPSGTTGTPLVQVSSVKPWAVPNCDPNNLSPANPNCAAGGYFIDSAGNVAHPSSVTGPFIDLQEDVLPASAPEPGHFVAVDLPVTATSISCPSSAAIWGTCSAINCSSPGYFENIAGANLNPVKCGDTLNVNPNSGNSAHFTTAQNATLCLIHATRRGGNRGQDTFNVGTPPITIDGGGNNPDPSLQTANNISRSDSVVTVPVFDCVGGACVNPVTVIGFLQLGIERVRAGTNLIRTIVLNVSACSASPASTSVAGGGVSPIPVRLVQ